MDTTYVQLYYHLCIQSFLLLDWIVCIHFIAAHQQYLRRVHYTVLKQCKVLQNQKKILALQHAVVVPDRALFPVIAAVHASGHVIGLGVDLIYACDIRYSASNCQGGGVNHFFKLASKLFCCSYEVDVQSRPWFSRALLLPKTAGNQSLIVNSVNSALELAKFIATKSPIAVPSSEYLLTHSEITGLTVYFFLLPIYSKYSLSSASLSQCS